MPLQISPGGRVLYVHPVRPINQNPVPNRREAMVAFQVVREKLKGECAAELDILRRALTSENL